jgi:hypothetical protein
MYIAYLNSEAASNLEYDSPTGFGSELDKQIDGQKCRMQAVLEHPETEFYLPLEFALAFNNEEISDLGYIAMVEDDKTTLIY